MITVITRSLNEEHRVGQFCAAYTDAGKIIIADGGSTDDTVKIAKMYHNVEVINFTERVELAGGHWRNPDSKHVNFAIEHANKDNPDWIILDDIDCRPNILVKEFLRTMKHGDKEVSEEMLGLTGKNFIMITRIYLWGLDQHFPHLAQPAGVWEPSMYAWRGDLDFWTVDEFPHYSLRVGERKIPYPGFDDEAVKLLPPYALIHYTWDKTERVDAKLKHHREGLGDGMNHPLDMGGPPTKLEYWITE